MSIANLVGFAVGLDGIYDILRSAFDTDNLHVLVFSFVWFFASVQIMFEWRQEEYRRSGTMNNY